jgi:hypothetical protein
LVQRNKTFKEFFLIKSRYIFFVIFLYFFSCKKKEVIGDSTTYVRIYGENTWGFNDSKGKVVIPLGKYVFLNPIDEQDMILAKKGNKYGYINIHQNEIIPFKYEDIDLFSEGLAAAKIKGKYGYLDRKGNEIIAFQFDDVEGFNSVGFAIVSKNSKYGLINKKGNPIIPFEFQTIISLESVKLIAVSKNNKWAFYSIQGKQLSDFIYDEVKFSQSSLVLVTKNGKAGCLDSDLVEKIPFGKYNFRTSFNQNGLAIVSSKRQFGVINEKDFEIIGIKFDSIGWLQEEYRESDCFVAFKNKRLTLFTQKGNFIIDNIKDYFKDFCNLNSKIKTIYQVQGLNGLSGVVDDNGNILIPLKYEEIGRFRAQNKTVVKLKGKYGLVDSKNAIILPIENDYITSYEEQRYYVIKKKDKVGILDYNLKTIFDFVYQDISPCFYDKENYFIIKKDDKYGVIDRSGRIIIPLKYSEMSNWVEYGPGSNYHFVTKNNKYGLITKEGKVIIPTICDKLYYKNDKIIILSKNHKFGVVTIQNKPVIPFEYDIICLESFNPNRDENEFYVQKNGKRFVINNKNKVVRNKISEQEKEIMNFEMKFLK